MPEANLCTTLNRIFTAKELEWIEMVISFYIENYFHENDEKIPKAYFWVLV